MTSFIIEVEEIAEQEEKEQKEAEDMLDAKLACIAAAEAAKPKICSIQVKPIPGVANQGVPLYLVVVEQYFILRKCRNHRVLQNQIIVVE